MKKIAKIVPFRKLPRGLDFFDYAIPDGMKIEVGSVVTIPMKTGKIKGVVIDFADKSKFKKLKEVVTVENYSVGQKQIRFAQWFAEYYHYSLASIIQSMVAEPPLKKTTLRQERKINIAKIKITVSSKIKKLATQIVSSRNKKFIVFPHDQELKKQLWVELINSSKQTLIIIPSIEGINKFVQTIPIKYKDEIVVFTKDLTLSKKYYFEQWQKIVSGKAKIIVGTRNAVYAPFNNLEMIVVDEASHDDHKSWDQNPRFHSVECARKLQDIYKSKLIVCSNAPRIEDYYIAQNEKYQTITLGVNTAILPITMVDLVHHQGDNYYFSDTMMKNVKKALEKKEKYLLIVNKKGFAGQLKCFDCEHVPCCQVCGLPMVYLENKLKCLHCNIEDNKILQCNKCGSTNIKPLGIGQDQVYDFLKNNFPNKKISKDEKEKADIYVLTAQINLDTWQKVDHLGIVYMDSLMYIPDFSAHYNFYKTLRNLIFKAQNNSLKTITLQSRYIENPLVQFSSVEYHKFYQHEIENRKMFNYPPFVNLIKLFSASKDKSLAKHEAKLLHQNLQRFKQKVEISEPYLYYKGHVRGKFRYQILLKFKPENMQFEIEIINKIPKTWTIDKNPINII